MLIMGGLWDITLIKIINSMEVLKQKKKKNVSSC